MSTPLDQHSTLRRDIALMYANAAIWAVGNGMVSTTLVIYLALALGAPGSAIGLILAAPRFAGALRLITPALVAKLRRRKLLCLLLLAASGAVLIAMPHLASPQFWATDVDSQQTLADGLLSGVGVLVVCWCSYHLLEYCGVVLLWSWLGDMMPRHIRGRLIGRRESWLVIGRIIGILASFALVGFVRWQLPAAPKWEPFAWSAMVGAVLLLVSLAPLLAMSPRESRGECPPASTWKALLFCLTNRPFRRLLTFSFGLAVANGITASAQALYPVRVLGVSYEAMLGMRCLMRSGQACLAPMAGEWIDRYGARWIMFAAQLVVATGPLFFLAATPTAWWWIIGAFVAWIAYAATNVGLDHLKLALAPTTTPTPALAVYYAISDVTNGVMVVLGGLAYDRLTAGGADALRLYALLFVTGWVARTAIAGLVVRLIESVPAAEPHS